jgi:hypothetical protein
MKVPHPSPVDAEFNLPLSTRVVTTIAQWQINLPQMAVMKGVVCLGKETRVVLAAMTKLSGWALRNRNPV